METDRNSELFPLQRRTLQGWERAKLLLCCLLFKKAKDKSGRCRAGSVRSFCFLFAFEKAKTKAGRCRAGSVRSGGAGGSCVQPKYITITIITITITNTNAITITTTTTTTTTITRTASACNSNSMYVYIYIYRDVYIYIYIYIYRERERERCPFHLCVYTFWSLPLRRSKTNKGPTSTGHPILSCSSLVC